VRTAGHPCHWTGLGTLYGDSVRLQQVVWNLLSNAIKFTPSGGQVQLKLERSDSNAQIIVSDTGQGISPEFLPYVFDRFRQADGSSTRRHGGWVWDWRWCVISSNSTADPSTRIVQVTVWVRRLLSVFPDGFAGTRHPPGR